MSTTSRSRISPGPWSTRWLSERVCNRREAKHFLDLAAGRGLAPELDFRYLPSSEPDLSVAAGERCEQGCVPSAGIYLCSGFSLIAAGQALWLQGVL